MRSYAGLCLMLKRDPEVCVLKEQHDYRV